MSKDELFVARYAMIDPLTGRPGGDYLRVGSRELGSVKSIADLEYLRAEKDHPENPAFHMRRMFYTGSPFGEDILKLIEDAA